MVLKYGAFIQTIFDFVIIAFVLFLALKGINKLKNRHRWRRTRRHPRRRVMKCCWKRSATC